MNTSIRKTPNSFAAFLLAAGLAWAVSGELSAQVPGTWTNPAGGAWTTSGNWLNGIITGSTTSPGPGDAGTAFFNTLDLTSDIAVTTSGPRFVGHFNFSDIVPSNRSWSLSGDPLTLNAFAPTITTNGNLGTGAVTISSALAGIGPTTGLYKQGVGTLILTGNNTYTGNTYVHGGQLVLDYANGGRLPTTAPLQFGDTAGGYGHPNAGGGIFTLKGGTGGDVVHQMGSLTFSAGQSRLRVDSGASGVDTLQFQNVARGGSGSLHVDLRSSSSGVVGGVRISETSSGIINTALGVGVVDSTGVVIKTGVVGTGGLSVTDFGGTGFLAATSLGGGNYSIQRYTDYTDITTISGSDPADDYFVLANQNYKIEAQSNPLTLNFGGQFSSLLIDTSAATGSLSLGDVLTNTGGNASGIILSGAHNYEISGLGSLISTDTNTPFQLSAFGGGTLTVSAVLNAYRMAISGDGVVVLSNTSNVVSADPGAAVSYGIFDGGTLSISAASNLGSAGRTIYFDSGTLRTTQSDLLTLSGNMGTMKNLATFDVTQASGVLSLTGIISQNGQLAKTGAGTLLLSGANTYTGSTEVRAGTLRFGASNVIAAGQVWVNGGTLDLNGFSDTVGSVVLSSGSIIGSGTLTGTAYNFESGTASAVLAGAVNLTKTSGGTVTLSGANTYSGITTLSEGVLQAGNNAAFGTSALALNGGTLSSNSTDARTIANAVTFGGNVTLGNASNSGKLTFNGAGTLSGNRTITTASNVTYAGVIGGGSNGLTKAGTGTLEFSAANTYTGNTIVSAGTLLVNGSLSTASAVQVGVSGTLAGSGSVGVISGAGLVGPGNSPGILTAVSVDGDSGMDFSFEITASTPAYGSPTASFNDVLRLTDGMPFVTALDGDNTVTVDFSTLSLGVGQTYTGGFYASVDFSSSISGANFVFMGADGFTIAVSTVQQDANFGSGIINGYVTQFDVLAIPEPSTTLLLAGALTALVIFRRRRA